MTLQLTELSTSPLFVLASGLLFAPMNALVYLGLWNLGIKRAAGAPLEPTDVFVLRALVPATVVTLLLVPLGLLATIHPLLGYLSWIAIFLVWWTMPQLIDRDVGVGVALRRSLTLAQHNWKAMLGLGLMVVVFYLLAALTCGIGSIWFLPWFCNLLGVSWYRLAGVEKAIER